MIYIYQFNMTTPERIFVESYMHYPNKRSPTAVLYTGSFDPPIPDNPTRQQLGIVAFRDRHIIGFSWPNREFYTMVDTPSSFVTDANTLYLKTGDVAGARGDYLCIANHDRCGGDASTCKVQPGTSDEMYPERLAPDNLVVTKVKADQLKVLLHTPTPTCSNNNVAEGDKPGCIPDIVFAGGYFLWRATVGGVEMYAKYLADFTGCDGFETLILQPLRRQATPFCFRNSTLQFSADIGQPDYIPGILNRVLTFNPRPGNGAFWYQVGTQTFIGGGTGPPASPDSTRVYPFWLGGTKMAFAADHTRFLDTTDPFSPRASVDGFGYLTGSCHTNFITGWDQTHDWGVIGRPNANSFSDQNWEMIVPSDYWQIRDYIQNGFGQFSCCAATSLSLSVSPMCAEMGFDSTNNATQCTSLLKAHCVGTNLDTDECVQFCKTAAGDCDTEWSKYCEFGLTPAEALAKRNCGCFMPQSFMETYYESLFAKLPPAFQTALVREPICAYPQCGAAEVKNKRGPDATPCPSLQICYQNSVVNVTDQGTIIGDVSQLQDNECTVITNSSVPPTGTRAVNGTTTGTTAGGAGTLSTLTIALIVLAGVGGLVLFGILLSRRKPAPIRFSPTRSSSSY